MYPFTALVYVKHARTYHQTPELGRFKAFHFYHFGLGGRGPSGSIWARNPGDPWKDGVGLGF